MSGGGEEIEVVRGALDDRRSQEILRFWTEHGVLGEDTRAGGVRFVLQTRA
jgi:hypothetical protein